MSEYISPRVPDELKQFMDAHFQETHERWQGMSAAELLEDMPAPSKFAGAVILDPKGERDEKTVVMFAPHQQTVKPSMLLRAGFLQEAVMPDSRLVFMPNNGRSDDYYKLSPESRERIATGDMTPFYDGVVRMLEENDVTGDVYATGYSMGGITALGVASRNSDKFDVKLVDANEAPNKRRTPKELQNDFMHSGIWGYKAIADAEIPALSEVLSVPRLGADYARFALATLSKDNQALHAGMARQNFAELLKEATTGSDRLIKLGFVAGSLLVDEGMLHQGAVSVHQLTGGDIRVREYSGDAARKHTTGDNIAARALMFGQAVHLLAKRTA